MKMHILALVMGAGGRLERMNDMNIGKATAIFAQIKDGRYTTDQKGEAIYQVMNMPTHNGVTKDAMLDVIRYMWDMVFAYEDGATHE